MSTFFLPLHYVNSSFIKDSQYGKYSYKKINLQGRHK